MSKSGRSFGITKDTMILIQTRFKEVTGLKDIDLSKFPIEQSDAQKQAPKTNKKKSQKYGEVFTPIFLVDIMLQQCEDIDGTKTFLDECAGYGVFAVRLLRMLYNKGIDIDQYIKEKLYLVEIQKDSQQKLKYIFDNELNLYCGDLFNLKYAEETDRGILHFDEETKRWIND